MRTAIALAEVREVEIPVGCLLVVEENDVALATGVEERMTGLEMGSMPVEAEV